ncbi:MAG: hypothetical protein RBT75_02620 [Anaerolineae bacterium]|jgi:hypothetical protein|nr:hypothetical protein [Anaerolineae bacterium]
MRCFTTENPVNRADHDCLALSALIKNPERPMTLLYRLRCEVGLLVKSAKSVVRETGW